MQTISLFLLGLRDSLSPTWIKKVLFYTNPQTKEIHPDNKKLIAALARTAVQIVVFYMLLPFLLKTLGSYIPFLGFIYYYGLLLVTILTYGYTFFYFSDVYDFAFNIVKWNLKTCRDSKKQPAYGQLEVRQNSDMFSALSNKTKSFIFLACYGVFFLVSSLILIHIPYLGRINLIISQSFFNGIFYFLRKWPYDEYNLAFIEKKAAYLVGFGFTISVICNYIFVDSLLLSNGMYFLLSPWMIINMIVSSPPTMEINTPIDMVQVLVAKRHELGNGYNQHRAKLRQNPEYRVQILRSVFFLKPCVWATNKINNFIRNTLQNVNKIKSTQ